MIKTAIKFGIFVVVCLAFTVYLAFTIGNINVNDPLGRNYYTVSATFDDVTGLLPNDNVKVAGVVVGKVTGISVEKGRAVVVFRLKDQYKVPSDSSVQIRWRNLIGQRYIYINPGTATTTLQPGAAITDRCTGPIRVHCTTSVVDLGELFNKLGPIVQTIDPNQVNDFIDTVSQALDGNTDKLSKSIDDLALLAKTLGDRDATIGRLVSNLNVVAGTITNRDQQIRVMLDNLVLISSTFSANTGTLDSALTELGKFSTSLNTVVSGNEAELNRIISNLNLVTTDEIAPRIQTLDQALQGIDKMAQKVFDSSSYGEWLNQAILCAGALPPTPGLPANCTGLGPILGTANSPGILATSSAASATNATAAAAPPNPTTAGAIGNEAPSNTSGAAAIVQMLLGGAR